VRSADSLSVILAYQRNEKRLLDVMKMTSSLIGRTTDLNRAQACIGALLDAGLEPNAEVYTAMVSACVRGGEVDRAFQVFEEEIARAEVAPNEQTWDLAGNNFPICHPDSVRAELVEALVPSELARQQGQAQDMAENCCPNRDLRRK